MRYLQRRTQRRVSAASAVESPLQCGARAGIVDAQKTNMQRMDAVQAQTQATPRSALYASAGSRLVHYEVDAEKVTLTERATLTLPADVQYAWPHASRRHLYVACSDGNPDSHGTQHWLVTLAIDGDSGALRMQGAALSLRWRPLHISTDIDSTHVFVTYNVPSTVSVHQLHADGSVGAEVAQPSSPDFGVYAHQVRVAPSNTRVLVVTRGNDAEAGKPEDPGALLQFDYRQGVLSQQTRIAPGGGLGYGPRHLDFHPREPWVYVSLERQNQLQMYDFSNEMLSATPRYTKGTLADLQNDHRAQKPGTLHLHPAGRFVYLANRARASRELDGRRVFAGGENNIAVYAIDAATGEPHLIQHADTRGIAPRTFALEPGGRMLVAANLMAMTVADATGVKTVAAGLAVFAVGDDGRLTFMRKHDIDTGSGQLFWMGIVAL